MSLQGSSRLIARWRPMFRSAGLESKRPFLKATVVAALVANPEASTKPHQKKRYHHKQR